MKIYIKSPSFRFTDLAEMVCRVRENTPDDRRMMPYLNDHSGTLFITHLIIIKLFLESLCNCFYSNKNIRIEIL
jgi:hypothetical protein